MRRRVLWFSCWGLCELFPAEVSHIRFWTFCVCCCTGVVPLHSWFYLLDLRLSRQGPSAATLPALGFLLAPSGWQEGGPAGSLQAAALCSASFLLPCFSLPRVSPFLPVCWNPLVFARCLAPLSWLWLLRSGPCGHRLRLGLCGAGQGWPWLRGGQRGGQAGRAGSRVRSLPLKGAPWWGALLPRVLPSLEVCTRGGGWVLEQAVRLCQPLESPDLAPQGPASASCCHPPKQGCPKASWEGRSRTGK